MSKIFPDGTFHFNGEGYILKPPDWVAPEPKIKEILEGRGYEPIIR